VQQVVLALKTPYRDGTTPIVISPLEFMQRLPAVVPTAAGIASGDLPAGVTVLGEGPCPRTDEGRAMMEIIHDVAPGASQAPHGVRRAGGFRPGHHRSRQRPGQA
jgi:hypothetical protein